MDTQNLSEEKLNHIAFSECERNCNTCHHLVRLKHEKQKDGMLFGKCAINSQELSEDSFHKRDADGVMKFHPNDPMHMPCYVSRWRPELGSASDQADRSRRAMERIRSLHKRMKDGDVSEELKSEAREALASFWSQP